MTGTKRGGRVWGGLVILVIGVLFLVANLTDWDIPWGDWWPVILIAWGLWNLVRERGWFGGTIMTVVGVFFLLSTLEVWDYTVGDIWRFWPVILIVIGAKILFTRRKKRSRSHSHSSAPHHFEDKSEPGELNITSVFGGSTQRVTDQALAEGSVTSVFGGAEIDLRGAALAGGEATLEVYAIFGGATLRVPGDWAVDSQITNVLGGVDDKRSRQPSDGAAGRLTLTGVSLFGGVTIES